ncbi:MAG: PAAR domain-containing protein, partial [Janthinobacterium lividum]|nr:PAAR domain-containing protein [Janthinobacterium lividum]
MKHEGRRVIRINDQTDHGGKVTSASSGTIVMGLAAALEDDMTICPQCKGAFAIKTDRVGAKHEGRHYAYHGDVAECGARLISSLSPPIGEAPSGILQAAGMSGVAD